MKKIIIYIVTIFMLILMGAYLAYKVYNMNYYSLHNLKNYETYSKGLYIKDTINIKHKELSADEPLEYIELLSFNDMVIRNDFKKFTKLEEPHSTDKYVKYVLYDDNNEATTSIWIADGYSYVDMYSEEVIVFNSDDTRYEQLAFKEFFKEKRIIDDIDLINYLVKTINKPNTIFNSIEDMKSNYMLHYLFSMRFEFDGITLIEGDLKGYMVEYKLADKKVVEVDIFKDEKIYGITFFNRDYFTDQYIEELLNTIEIK